MKTNKMLNNVRAVIFDVDGTLVDSMWVWQDVDKEYIEKYHLHTPDNFYETMEGMSYSEVAQYFLDEFPQLTHTKESLMSEWRSMAYEKYMYEVPFKEGGLSFIKMLRENDVKLGIATSNELKMVVDMLRTRGISEYFDSVHSACEVSAGKPCPDVYLLVAKDLDVHPEQCLVFEDVPMGILAGKNAGMKVCAVDDDFSRHQEERKKELADYFIHSYHDVLNNNYEILK